MEAVNLADSVSADSSSSSKLTLHHNAINIAGTRYGALTAIAPLFVNKHHQVVWEFLCDCGNKISIPASVVKIRNEFADCGCGCGNPRKWDKGLTTFNPSNMGRFCDITGDKFNKLTALYPVSSSSIGQVVWRFRCDCGNEIEQSSSRVKNKFVTSCGCTNYGELSSGWAGYAELSGKYWGGIQNSAKKRRHTFDITKEYVWELFLRQGRKCALSGLPIFFNDTRNSIEQTASLDRIDSSIGYFEGNVQWVHKDVNKMKNVFSQEYFIHMCKLIGGLDSHA